MKILYLILGLLVISQCQEQIIENWLPSNPGKSMFFVKPTYDWSNIKDFAVYGWYKIEPRATLKKQSVLFHLTANANGDSSFNKKIGDFVFGVLYKDKKLTIGTYSSPNHPYYSVNVDIRTQDVDKWTFFYVAYSSSKSKLYYRFEFDEVYFNWGSVTGVKHNISTYYKLFIGEQLNYSKFPGQISKFNIHAGKGAYRENGFTAIIPFNTNKLPSSLCPLVFDKCDYKGNYYEVCSTDNKVPPKFPIKSIYLPPGWTIDIHLEVGVLGWDINTPCYSYDLTAEYRDINVHFKG